MCTSLRVCWLKNCNVGVVASKRICARARLDRDRGSASGERMSKNNWHRWDSGQSHEHHHCVPQSTSFFRDIPKPNSICETECKTEKYNSGVTSFIQPLWSMPRTPSKTPVCNTSSTLLQPPPRFFCNILQHISTTLLSETPVPSSTTSLHTFSITHLCNSHVECSSATLLPNTPAIPSAFLQHACTQPLGNTSCASVPTLLPYTPLHISPTLRYNTSVQHFSPTLFYRFFTKLLGTSLLWNASQ